MGDAYLYSIYIIHTRGRGPPDGSATLSQVLLPRGLLQLQQLRGDATPSSRKRALSSSIGLSNGPPFSTDKLVAQQATARRAPGQLVLCPLSGPRGARLLGRLPRWADHGGARASGPSFFLSFSAPRTRSARSILELRYQH